MFNKIILFFLLAFPLVAQHQAVIGPVKPAGTPIQGFNASIIGESGGGGSDLLPPIPSTNLIEWYTYTGLEGNAYPARTLYTNLDNTVTSSDINSALVAAATNQIVLLTNKTFWLTGATEVSIQGKSGKTLRGMGPDQTILVVSNNLLLGTEQGRSRLFSSIFSGATKGSSNIMTRSNLVDYHIGAPLFITATNDWSYVHPYGYENVTPLYNSYSDENNTNLWGVNENGNRARGEIAKLISVSNGTNLVIWPPLSDDYTSTPAQVEYVPDYYGSVNQWVGLENMTIRLNRTQVRFLGSQNTWMSNVVIEIYGGDQPSVFLPYCYRAQIEHCTFLGYNNRASAIVPQVLHGGARVQNNIFSNVYQAILNVGRGANDGFVYNYCASPTNSTTAYIMEFGSHGVHTMNDLWEGNVGYGIHIDSIHGSGSKKVLKGNYLKGEVVGITTSGYGCIRLDSFQPWCSIEGNTLGYSGMSGWIFEEISPGDNSTNAIIAWDYSGFSSTVDTGRVSRATAIIHGNTHYASGSAVTQWDSTRTQTLTNSYIFTNRPYFWGTNIPWPMNSITNPAYYRAMNGTNSF